MTVKGIDIISMIVGNEDLTIVRIIRESSILKFKLQNSKLQTWYFQKGIESNKKQLAGLYKQYEAYRKQFNQISPDELIKLLNNTYDKEKKIRKLNYLGLHGHLALASTLSKRRQLNEFIALKNRVTELMPIEYYAGNPGTIRELII